MNKSADGRGLAPDLGHGVYAAAATIVEVARVFSWVSGDLLSEPGMASDGVVAVQPSERVQPGLTVVGERAAALEGLAFEGRVEGLGDSVVGGLSG